MRIDREFEMLSNIYTVSSTFYIYIYIYWIVYFSKNLFILIISKAVSTRRAVGRDPRVINKDRITKFYNKKTHSKSPQ